MNRWGQIAILTAIADYKVSGGKEAESICDRVMPRLQHANGAVVLSAIKVYTYSIKRYSSLLTYFNLIRC
jgi:vesicle coat complex subunit